MSTVVINVDYVELVPGATYRVFEQYHDSPDVPVSDHPDPETATRVAGELAVSRWGRAAQISPCPLGHWETWPAWTPVRGELVAYGVGMVLPND